MEKLIVFAKAPRIGQVKTRLAQEVGEQAALEIYRRLLSILFENLASIKHTQVAVSPDNATADFTGLVPKGWKASPQGEGDLGARLQRAFQDAFTTGAGAGRVLVIGTDCPYITPEHIAAASKSLSKNDLVLGPATDGGYWLIGLRAPCPALFEGISWSTSEVLAQTLAKAKLSGLRIDLLEILSDVDTHKDWKEYQRTRSRNP